jgi:DNA-binding MarR family transcriptional regulator
MRRGFEKIKPGFGMEIKKCPPGIARGAHLQLWQFYHESGNELAHPQGTARLANGDLSQQEAAILTTVLHQPGPISQREIEAIMAERLGMSRSQVYNTAQRLAENGSICRRKIGSMWHYWRAGLMPTARKVWQRLAPQKIDGA